MTVTRKVKSDAAHTDCMAELPPLAACSLQGGASSPVQRPSGAMGHLIGSLHDELSQLLSMALIHLDEVQSAQCPRALDRSQRLVRQAMLATRGLLRNLVQFEHHVPPLEADLALRLQRCVQGLEQSHGTQIAFSCDGNPGHLPPWVSDTLVRSTSELLINALKHAPTGAIEARVAARPGRLAITVSSQGPGLVANITSPDSGWGLSLLRHNLEPIGANLRWRSLSARGVQARIRWSGSAV